MLTGSLGMLPSASLGRRSAPGVFEPVHGSAPGHRGHRQGQPAGDDPLGGAHAAPRIRPGGGRFCPRIGSRQGPRARTANRGPGWKRDDRRGHRGGPEGDRREPSGPHLDERRVRRPRGREGARTHARAALRDGRLRGRPRLRDPARDRDLPPPGPHRAAVPLGRHVLHGDPVHARGDPRRDARDDPAQRAEVLLHPPARLPRRRPDGPVPARLPGRGRDRGLGVGLLPRRRGQAARRPRARLLVAAAAQRRRHPGRQGHRPVPQLRARQDRGRQGRLRGGDPARHRTATSARARARTCSSSRTGSSPRRPTSPACSAASTAPPAIQIARDLGFELAGAPGRPRRALPRRRDLHDRHRGRADARARGRRPPGRHGRAGRDHARGPARCSRTRCTGARSATPTGTTWCPCPRRLRELDRHLRHAPCATGCRGRGCRCPSRRSCASRTSSTTSACR